MSVHALNSPSQPVSSLSQPIYLRASSAEFPQLPSQAPCVADAVLIETIDYSKLLQSQPFISEGLPVSLWVGRCSRAGDLVFRCQDIVVPLLSFFDTGPSGDHATIASRFHSRDQRRGEQRVTHKTSEHSSARTIDDTQQLCCLLDYGSL